MQDRVPLYPGRVMLTPVPGQENTFDMVRADSPTQEGTQLSKENLLKDATAAMFGLDASAVPDEVLAFLGKFNQHWWKRWEINTVLEEASRIDGYLYTGNTSAGKVYYSDSYTINSSGSIELINPTEITVGYTTYTNFNKLKGKYFYTTGACLPLTGRFWYMPSDAPDATRGGNSDTSEYYVKITVSELLFVSGDPEYITASSKDTYPYSGYIDGFKYLYFGVPFENAVDTRQFEIGTYVGTGESDTSVTLNFLKAPTYGVLIFGAQTSNNIAFTILTVGKTSAGVAMGNSTSGNTLTVDWGSGNSFVKFSYSSTSYPERRLNASGEVYTYLAF